MNLSCPETYKFTQYITSRCWTPLQRIHYQDRRLRHPPSVEVEGDYEYQVERVEDSRMYRNQLQYLVRWTGYDQMTWEPAKDVNGLQALDVFHARYPQKPGPLELVLGGPRS